MRTVLATLLLFVLWLLLSGHSDAFLLGLGILSCLFVAGLANKLGLFDENFSVLRFNLNVPRFLPWFIIEVIRSNLEVSRRILHPRLPIEPNISSVSAAQHDRIGKAVYANCITLTPGTYSLDIDEETISVHALTREFAEGLQKGEMSKRILALEAPLATPEKPD